MRYSGISVASGAIGLAIAASPAFAEPPNYVDFFTADNNAYEAYLDLNNQTTDGAGNRLVNVKMAALSDAFRAWIKKNIPGGETADYALDSFSIDCTGKTVGEHRIIFYDSDGFPLANYDFGGQMIVPIAGTMKYEMMRKVCGF